MYNWKPVEGWEDGNYWHYYKNGSIVGAVHRPSEDSPVHSHVFAANRELVVSTHRSMTEAAKFVIDWGKSENRT